MKISFRFLWYDIWIGIYIDRFSSKMYICPLPCCVFIFNFRYNKDMEYLVNYYRNCESDPTHELYIDPSSKCNELYKDKIK